ncbi:hypothetical protein CFP56_029404 [Quercus suber]|uniref:Uncharacterized protein n=1 Tax=Quercus suber TaxID=58331 RepID=A0AAW0JRT8_QUESU
MGVTAGPSALEVAYQSLLRKASDLLLMVEPPKPLVPDGYWIHWLPDAESIPQVRDPAIISCLMPRVSMTEINLLYSGKLKADTSSCHQSELVFFGLAPVLIPFHNTLPPGLCMGPLCSITGHPNRFGSVHALEASDSMHLFVMLSSSAYGRTSSQNYLTQEDLCQSNQIAFAILLCHFKMLSSTPENLATSSNVLAPPGISGRFMVHPSSTSSDASAINFSIIPLLESKGNCIINY